MRRSNLLDVDRTDEEIDNDVEVIEIEPVVNQEAPDEAPDEEIGSE